MTTFPDSPRLQKGALIGLDPFNPLASIIIFQYNPETRSRTLRARTTPVGGGGGGQTAPGEAMRLAGPSEESFKLDVVLDATDQMEQADPITAQLGDQVAPAIRRGLTQASPTPCQSRAIGGAPV